MRTAVRRAPMAATFIACVLLATVLYGCLSALGECPPLPQDFDGGTDANGLSTDEILAPLLGDHVATLTWLLPNRTTTMRLHVEHLRGVAHYDCDGHFGGFDLWVDAQTSTDDGIIPSPTAKDAGAADWARSGADVRTDASGRPEADPTFAWTLDLATLRSAGVVDPSLTEHASDSVLMSVTTLHLKPVDGVIQSANSNTTARVTVGTIHFSS